MLKRLNRARLFCSALLQGAALQWLIHRKLNWRVAPAILRALCDRTPVNRKPGSDWWRRLKGCRKCPVFDRSRRVCQVVFHEDDKRMMVGCGCFIPLKGLEPTFLSPAAIWIT